MTPASAKAKGRTLQNNMCVLLRSLYGCHYDDIRPAIMGESGADVKVSPALRSRFPYSIECKNQERISLWDALAQAEAHARHDTTTPALVFHRNRSKTWVAIPVDDWLHLLKIRDDARQV